MSVRRHLHYGSTPNFNNLYHEVQKNTDKKGRLTYANYDPSLGEPPTPEQVELLQSYQPVMPTITFNGSEKLHGENMAVCYSQGEIWVQGRNHVRTILGDQNGMAQFVENTKASWLELMHQVEDLHLVDSGTHTIVLDCEWAGGNIQKGNAACSGTDKGAYLFDYVRVVDNITDEASYKLSEGLVVPANSNIYLMKSFGSYELVLDFNNPSECEIKLTALAEQIEGNSPIAKFFEKPNNVGEGVYMHGTDGEHFYRVKAKGEKHGGKPKEPKEQASDEETKRLADLAEKITPVWRITQAITETEATEMKHTGQVIKWVIADIAKEELPVLAEAGVELKQISKYVSPIVTSYYKNSLKCF